MLLIGCPVYGREWILPYWFDRLSKQDTEHDIGFVFVVSRQDESTIRVINHFDRSEKWHSGVELVYEDTIQHSEHPVPSPYSGTKYIRKWNNESALRKMVLLRNLMLDSVRQVSPDWFFSLDSDILLDDTNSIDSLMTSCWMNEVDAISPLAYMSDTDEFPNLMKWLDDRSMQRFGMTDVTPAVRPKAIPSDGFVRADVIMAAKLMTPAAYSVDYEMHPLGEDLGWSRACREAGLKLGLDLDIYATHIMSPLLLREYLDNGDTRISNKKCLTV